MSGMTDNGTFPDGSKRLTLIGGFAIGLALAENVKSGAESAERMYVYRFLARMLDLEFSITYDDLGYRFGDHRGQVRFG